MAAAYGDWLARARTHLDDGRVLDALSCFRKAARLAPRAGEPLDGIADALWRLGKPEEAIVAWREAVARNPGNVPAWQAIADAASLVGDDALAGEATAHVLKAAPENKRALFVDACARLADPQAQATACVTLLEIVKSRPRLLERPQMARPLVRALARSGPGICLPLRKAIAAHADALALDLVAQVAPWVEPSKLRARLDMRCAPGDIDALRVIANALASHATGQAADQTRLLAQHAADRYSALCAAAFAADVPLMWPRRAAGARVRVVVLADATNAGDAGTAAGAVDSQLSAFELLLAALQQGADRIELSIGAFGSAQRAVELLHSTSFVGARVTQMPAMPDFESARSLAAADADLLIDLAGLAWPNGPLLAARPARRTIGRADVPHLAPPLVDATLPQDRGDWSVALARWVESVPLDSVSASTPDALHKELMHAIEAHRDRRHDHARIAYDAFLREQPAHAPALHLRGALLREIGDIDAAAGDFAAALAIAPRDAKSRVAAAQLALAAHRPAEARALLEAGLALDATDAAMQRMLGHAALALRDGATAINAFAAALGAGPFDAETHFNHGVALQMMRYLGDAARAYQRALDFEPSLADAHFNLGIVFDQLGETDSAIAALEYVLKRQPDRASAHRTLLDVLSRNDRGAEWMRAFARFERSCPNALGLVANALEYYQYLGDFAKVHRYAERLSRDEFKPANEIDLVDSLEQLLYLMLFFDFEPGTQSSLYATYDEAARRVYGEVMPRSGERRAGPLRIGYLSADFRDHVMGKMMLPVLQQHDRSRFEIHLFSTAPTEDSVTSAFRALGDPFVALADVADEEAVRRIAERDLDVLVDLSTHTRGARPGIVARKPARVQITHVASAGALGMSAVDFKLTDALADLPEIDELMVESLLRMEGSVYPFRRIEAAREHPFHRKSLGVGADAVVIGAFVTPLKLSRRTMALWKEILDRIPRARIAFSPTVPWLRDAYPRIMTAAGIDASRAIVLPQGRDDAENLARYGLVDFVLDPMPFGNVNGTIEPLNAGVPVVTLCGRTHGERTGFSILTNLGVTSTIAMSGREYVDIAVRLADDTAFRDSVRREILARVADSPVTDMQGYARRLEAAYVEALALAAPEGSP